jgi:hypothetical protein
MKLYETMIHYMGKKSVLFQSLPSFLILIVIITLCGCTQPPDSALPPETEGETTLGPKASGGDMFSVEEGKIFVEIRCQLPENHCVKLELMDEANHQRRHKNMTYSTIITRYWCQEENMIKQELEFHGNYWVIFTNLNTTQTPIQYQMRFSHSQ